MQLKRVQLVHAAHTGCVDAMHIQLTTSVALLGHHFIQFMILFFSKEFKGDEFNCHSI